MSEITVSSSISGQQWLSPEIAQDKQASTAEMHEAQELYKLHREAEKRLLYNQLTATEQKPPSKDRGSRMASIVAQQRIII